MGSDTMTHRIWAFTRRALLIAAVSLGIVALSAIGVYVGVVLGLWTYIEFG